MDDTVQQLVEDLNRLRGRLFQAIEATGMEAKQEEAVKGLVRRLSYDIQADLVATLRLRG